MVSHISQYSVLSGKPQLELNSIFSALSLYLEKKRQRKQLLQLDDHLLNDIGVSRQQAINEANS